MGYKISSLYKTGTKLIKPAAFTRISYEQYFGNMHQQSWLIIVVSQLIKIKPDTASNFILT